MCPLWKQLAYIFASKSWRMQISLSSCMEWQAYILLWVSFILHANYCIDEITCIKLTFQHIIMLTAFITVDIVIVSLRLSLLTVQILSLTSWEEHVASAHLSLAVYTWWCLRSWYAASASIIYCFSAINMSLRKQCSSMLDLQPHSCFQGKPG